MRSCPALDLCCIRTHARDLISNIGSNASVMGLPNSSAYVSLFSAPSVHCLLTMQSGSAHRSTLS